MIPEPGEPVSNQICLDFELVLSNQIYFVLYIIF